MAWLASTGVNLQNFQVSKRWAKVEKFILGHKTTKYIHKMPNRMEKAAKKRFSAFFIQCFLGFHNRRNRSISKPIRLLLSFCLFLICDFFFCTTRTGSRRLFLGVKCLGIFTSHVMELSLFSYSVFITLRASSYSRHAACKTRNKSADKVEQVIG